MQISHLLFAVNVILNLSTAPTLENIIFLQKLIGIKKGHLMIDRITQQLHLNF